jgi:hypothetical protein
VQKFAQLNNDEKQTKQKGFKQYKTRKTVAPKQTTISQRLPQICFTTIQHHFWLKVFQYCLKRKFPNHKLIFHKKLTN